MPLHHCLEGGSVASIILCSLRGNQVTDPSLKLKGPLLKAFSEKQRPAHSRAQWLSEPRRTFEDAPSSPPASTKKQTFLTTAAPQSLPYLASPRMAGSESASPWSLPLGCPGLYNIQSLGC